MRAPRPEPGLIVSYAYLWHREKLWGKEEARKDRPAVVLLALINEQGVTTVIVLPITHRPPRQSDEAVEIPASVKRHLGLDTDRAWIVVAEGNRFTWPGYDLRRRPDGKYVYGFLPPHFFEKVRRAFLTFHRSHRVRLVPRD